MQVDYNSNEYDKDLEGLQLMQKKLDLSLGLRYMTAGKSILTFVNTSTDKQFTYRITCSNMVWRNRYYVSVLTGKNNTKDYSYIGVIEYANYEYKFLFAPTHIKAECNMSINADSVQAFIKIFAKLSNLGYVYNDNGVKLTSSFAHSYKFDKLETAEGIIKKYNLTGYVIEKYADTRKYKQKGSWKSEVIKEYYCIHTPIIWDNFEIWRSTHCLRCGKLLTVKKSIEQNFGPHCIKQFLNGY
jgi:hypothetical protein